MFKVEPGGQMNLAVSSYSPAKKTFKTWANSLQLPYAN